MKRQPIVLSIAGSDNTGGAGIQADIKTCCRFSVYAATVISGVTAQNSNAVYAVEPVSEKVLLEQIDSIFEVMRPDAIKTGMLPSPVIIELVASRLRKYDVVNFVADPVMVATNGGALVSPGSETVDAFRKHLLPLATLVTPNIPEASAFLGRDIASDDPGQVCRELLEICNTGAVLLKGGHSGDNIASDILYDGKFFRTFSDEKIDTPNTHGTGCSLSAAIACGLAKGLKIDDAVAEGKRFVSNAIKGAADLCIMHGPGPLDFFV